MNTRSISVTVPDTECMLINQREKSHPSWNLILVRKRGNKIKRRHTKYVRAWQVRKRTNKAEVGSLENMVGVKL